MLLKATEMELPGILTIEPNVFGDERGFFFESFNQDAFTRASGVTSVFVQDNHSKSAQGVLRGLHYQIKQSQGKLVRVVEGTIFDVAVDIRRGSATFGQWLGMELSAESKKQIWIPPDFAHGFLVISEFAQVLYKTTDYYSPEYERSIRWDDPEIGIDWPELPSPPLLSLKDSGASCLADAELPNFLP